MAIHQFAIELLPREPIVARFGAVPAELPDEDVGWIWARSMRYVRFGHPAHDA